MQKSSRSITKKSATVYGIWKIRENLLAQKSAKYILYIPHSVQYKYAEQPKECTGSYEYESKKPRRVNRKWEEITAAFGILSDTTDSSLLEMSIPDKI